MEMALDKKIKVSIGSDNQPPLMLVVDDSKTMRKAAEKMLSKEFRVLTAEDGEEGWRSIAQHQDVSVVFTDLNMPEVDGFELLERIRSSEDEGISGLPVIIVTGKGDDEEAREKALSMGATDFIAKPFNSTDLLARARSNANYQRLQRKLSQESTLDPVTHLYNAAYFNERLKKDLAFCQRHGHVLSVLKIEVDQFKDVYLKNGKEIANRIIKEIADLLRERFRKEDTIARLSLTQFAISLPSGQYEGAMALAKMLNPLLTKRTIRVPSGHNVSLTVSVSTPEPHPGLTARSLLEEIEVVHKQALAHGAGTVWSDRLARENDQRSLPATVQTPPADSLFDTPASKLSVDKALQLIAKGHSEALQPHVNGLIRKLIPLLLLTETPIRHELIEQLQKDKDV